MNYEGSNNPTVLVLFGATGDLSKKKIIPTLFELYKKKVIYKNFKVIGFARRYDSAQQFRRYIKDEITKEANDEFLQMFEFVHGDILILDDFKKLKDALKEYDQSLRCCTDKLFYLSVSPKYYEKVFENISLVDLLNVCENNDIQKRERSYTRILVEKPFGSNFRTAVNLEKKLARLFHEEQIFRVDHYLGKEMLQNIFTFRFANKIFSDTWSNKSIESIEITFFEDFGVEGRGEFYDEVGALRDVGQNHILQMLAYITMEKPVQFSSEFVRKERERVFDSLKIMSQAEVIENTSRKQSKAYKSEEGVSPDSKTETYFELTCFLENQRWRGVPIKIRSGKYMPETKTEIVVNFKNDIGLFDIKPDLKNRVVFQFKPKEMIMIEMLHSNPGLEKEIGSSSIVFDYDTEEIDRAQAGEYEHLLVQCLKGEQMMFLSSKEVEQMWSFIDPIIRVWQNDLVKLEYYD